MALPRHIWVGILASAALIAGGLLMFVQTKDPMIPLFAGQLSVFVWVGVVAYHVLTRGFPIRIVDDERR